MREDRETFAPLGPAIRRNQHGQAGHAPPAAGPAAQPRPRPYYGLPEFWAIAIEPIRKGR